MQASTNHQPCVVSALLQQFQSVCLSVFRSRRRKRRLRMCGEQAILAFDLTANLRNCVGRHLILSAPRFNAFLAENKTNMVAWFTAPIQKQRFFLTFLVCRWLLCSPRWPAPKDVGRSIYLGPPRQYIRKYYVKNYLMATASAADPLSRYRKAAGLLREQIRVAASWHCRARC